MSDAFYPIDGTSLLLEADAARAAGKSKAEAYQPCTPYPHICIDNVLPSGVQDHVREDLKVMPGAEQGFSRAQENLKTSYNPDRLPEFCRKLFHSLNSRHFLMFLEEMTGISSLIPDPYFIGVGIHRIGNGGQGCIGLGQILAIAQEGAWSLAILQVSRGKAGAPSVCSPVQWKAALIWARSMSRIPRPLPNKAGLA